MTDPPDAVKAHRYDARRRRVASRDRREQVLEAARALFLERGYRASTVSAIAQRAGVHVDTVYELVGPKPTIVRELIERAISGGAAAVPARERDYVAAIRSAATAREKIAIYAAALAPIMSRVAPLVRALADAASTDGESRRVWREISDRRARNMREFVLDLSAAGGLRTGLSTDEAADTVWLTNSPEAYLMLTEERGWSPERYRRWIEATWSRLLLEDASP